MRQFYPLDARSLVAPFSVTVPRAAKDVASGCRIFGADMLTVIDPGPILLSAIQRFDDPDVETALANGGLDPAITTFRLVEVSLADLEDVRWFPGPFRCGTFMVDALRVGRSLPPIVIVASRETDGQFGILDGVNRTHAHWVLGRKAIRAYELITVPRRSG
jgi:hypothetical protein